jgi:hypothetical protein
MNEMNTTKSHEIQTNIIDKHKIHITANIESIYDFTPHCIHRIQPQFSFIVFQIINS